MGTLGRAIYTVGFWIRETGQAIDRLGCRLQGNYLFQEQCKIPPFPPSPSFDLMILAAERALRSEIDYLGFHALPLSLES